MKRQNRSDEPSSATATLLDEILDAGIAAASPAGSVVAEVVDDRHPTLLGRVCVRFVDAVRDTQRWVPTLHGLPVRTGDRVLLQQPSNWREPIVVGVIDGFEAREPSPAHACARIELRRDESVRVCDHRGRALLELREGEHGPVVVPCTDDLEIAVPGHLELRGSTVCVRAEAGSAEVEATDDVVLRGEAIHLN